MENIKEPKIAAFEIQGVIESISPLIPLKRIKEGVRLQKRLVTIRTGNTEKLPQLIYIDFVNLKMKPLKKVKEGDKIRAWVSFRGYDHEGRKYNNIYGHNIEKL